MVTILYRCFFKAVLRSTKHLNVQCNDIGGTAIATGTIICDRRYDDHIGYCNPWTSGYCNLWTSTDASVLWHSDGDITLPLVEIEAFRRWPGPGSLGAARLCLGAGA
jgi:hypothetical protein